LIGLALEEASAQGESEVVEGKRKWKRIVLKARSGATSLFGMKTRETRFGVSLQAGKIFAREDGSLERDSDEIGADVCKPIGLGMTLVICNPEVDLEKGLPLSAHLGDALDDGLEEERRVDAIEDSCCEKRSQVLACDISLQMATGAGSAEQVEMRK
jgi:hypothetical protein